ncbi:MAG: hypothetical protein HY735_18960 [Verrucomicrobia bacterium]|nr:hypothetical protein [Verrucomicrobiota bacterium]
MTTEHKIESPPASKPLAVKIVGLGCAGIHMAEFMIQTDLRDLAFAVVHSDARALAASTIPNKCLIGTQILHGLGAGGDPALGQASAEEDLQPLRSLCEETDLMFILTGLGGGTGTGAAPALARLAGESGALVLAVVTLPFEFEGARRQQQARWGLQRLQAAADGVLCLPHQRMAKLLEERSSALEAFKATHEHLAQGVRSIWQMLTKFGLLNVEFADLCSVLRGRHCESAFACAQAAGEERARLAVETLAASPLLEEGKLFSEAEAVLVSVVGGPDLTLADVNGVMQRMNQQAEQARFMVGAIIDDGFQGRLGVTVILARRGQPRKETAFENRGASALEVFPAGLGGPEIENQFFGVAAQHRPASRFVPPAPKLSPEQTRRLLEQRPGSAARRRKSIALWSQGQLPLEIVSRGRFEQSEPTLHQGEDLDVPTYIRRGVSLN